MKRKESRLQAQHKADLADERQRIAEEHARAAAEPGATVVQAAHPGPQAGEALNVQDSVIAALVDTLVKKVLIPEIHKRFGGTVPLAVLNDATRLLLDGVRRREAGRTFQTGKQLVLFALNEALRTVDEARS